MKHFIYLPILLAVIVYGYGNLSAQAFPPAIQVNEAAELTAALMRAADYEEYRYNGCANYACALDSLLESVSEHPAVDFARTIRNSGMGYDGVAGFALALEIHNDSVRFNPEFNTVEMLGERWYYPTAEKMLNLLDDFYRASNFHKFYLSQQDFYARASENMKTMLSNVDFKWLENFYGVPFDKVKVLLSFSNDGNYGMTQKFKNGSNIFSPWICAYPVGNDGIPSYSGYEGIIIHEGTHPVTNPLVEKHLRDFNSNSERTLELSHDQLSRMAYGTSDAIIYETIVRACNKRYDLAHSDNKTDSIDVLDALRREGATFLSEESIFNALGEYEKNRDKYSSISDFMPELIHAHNTTSPDSVYNEYVRRAPNIIKYNIDEGAVLQPGEFEFTMVFDKPVIFGFGVGVIKGLECPDVSGMPSRSEDKKTFTLKLLLEPGKQYGMAFPGWFGSIDHYYNPKTVELRFSTLDNTSK